jgi:hypothetical protein
MIFHLLRGTIHVIYIRFCIEVSSSSQYSWYTQINFEERSYEIDNYV